MVVISDGENSNPQLKELIFVKNKLQKKAEEHLLVPVLSPK